jgi:peptidyl-prolyl cis-trans isomerase SurA
MFSTSSQRKHSGSLAVVLLGLFLAGCSPKEHDAVVATIGNDPMTLSEYEKLYIKSNGTRDSGTVASQEDREKFLDLVVKYKLKLKDAYSQGLDKKPEINQEIGQYKGSLAQSFLTEREVTSPGVKKLYARRSEEIHAAHILLELTPNASPAESAAAYKDAYDIIAKAKSGTDFSSLAIAFSKDPSVKENKGDLYYFTGGDFVSQFEDAAFSMKPGEISSAPVRTKYGLHIIKLFERKPAPGDVRANHIMIRFPSMSPNPDDTVAAYKKIVSVQDSLKLGVGFVELAKRNSDDGGSAGKGGDLGWFTRRRWVRPFDDVVMTLQPGQVSGIVRTQYGYHLIRCAERRPPKPFEEARPELEQMYQQRLFADDNARYLGRLKSELAFTRDDSVVARVLASCDPAKTVHDSAWDARIPLSLRRSAVMSLLGQPVTVDSLVAMLKARPDMASVRLEAPALNPALDKIAEQLVFSTKADLIAKNNPEFAAILKEYKEGILIYQVEQDRVWSKISPSDSLLKLHFAANRDKFTFPDRVRFSEIRLSNEAAARAVRERAIKGTPFEQIVAEDSLRMKLPSNFKLLFNGTSVAPGADAKKSIAQVGEQLTHDKSVSVRLSAFPDTAAGKKKNVQLASRRIEAVKSLLVKDFGIGEERIVLAVTPQPVNNAATKSDRTVLSHTLSLDIQGRQPLLVGSLQKLVVPPPTDERSKRADSLAVGGISVPFYHQNGYSLVQLEAREPARQKTFEEATPEASTSFQDAESKRLEKEWMNGLKTRFPVQENKASLKDAFKPGR